MLMLVVGSGMTGNESLCKNKVVYLYSEKRKLVLQSSPLRVILAAGNR